MRSYYGSALLVAGAALGYISAIELLSLSGQEPAPIPQLWQVQTASPKLGYAIYANGHFRQQGLLPPPRNTQVFSRISDEDGATLRSDCTYTLTSRAPLARWWSLNSQSVENATSVHSLDAGETFITGQDELIVSIAKDHQAGNWLPLESSNTFKLTLVLIEPITDPKRSYILPTLKKDSCS